MRLRQVRVPGTPECGRPAGVSQAEWSPVMSHARPPTTVPITAPVTEFQNIQVGPQPGVASRKKPGGISIKSPHNGPRKYQGRGHSVIPTSQPMSRRAR